MEPRLMRLPELQARVGLGKTMIYALIKQNAFPKPVKVGNVSLWSSSVVSEWIDKQVADQPFID